MKILNPSEIETVFANIDEIYAINAKFLRYTY
jgi:hypothetical protein